MTDHHNARTECAICAAHGVMTETTRPTEHGWLEIPSDRVRDGLTLRRICACPACAREFYNAPRN